MPSPRERPSRNSNTLTTRVGTSPEGNVASKSKAQYSIARSATFFDETAKVETVLQSASLSRAVAYRDRTCPRKKNAAGEYETFQLLKLSDVSAELNETAPTERRHTFTD